MREAFAERSMKKHLAKAEFRKSIKKTGSAAALEEMR